VKLHVFIRVKKIKVHFELKKRKMNVSFQQLKDCRYSRKARDDQLQPRLLHQSRKLRYVRDAFVYRIARFWGSVLQSQSSGISPCLDNLLHKLAVVVFQKDNIRVRFEGMSRIYNKRENKEKNSY